MTTIAHLLAALDNAFPFARAESWDKVGLLVGDEKAPVHRVLVSYEITEAVLQEAREQRSDAIIAYHPLIFRPLDNLNYKNHTARLVAQLIGANQSLICVHTALDGAPTPRALGDALAAQLELKNVRVHKPSGTGKLVKIVTFVPPEALSKVSNAMWEAGAGQIGRYDQASFRASGTGTFRPLPGANPYCGTLGEREEADEWRIEVVSPSEKWRGVVAAMKVAHPYEEVAFDVIEMQNADDNSAYGPLRLGDVIPQSLEQFIETVRTKLNPPSLRLVRPAGFETVQTVACSPGSGASFIDALPSGTCFVSGDIKHHDALKALAKNIAIIDVSHAATETAAIPLMADALKTLPNIKISQSAVETNPFSSL